MTHRGESKVSVGMASQRTRGHFPQLDGNPAGSMGITCLVCQQVESQHGPRTR